LTVSGTVGILALSVHCDVRELGVTTRRTHRVCGVVLDGKPFFYKNFGYVRIRPVHT
jgi:hypothetical protein